MNDRGIQPARYELAQCADGDPEMRVHDGGLFVLHSDYVKEIERLHTRIDQRDKQLSERLQQTEELKQKLTAAEQLAVRQGNEIRKLRGERA